MKRENVLVPEDALARQRDFEAKIKEMFNAREAHPVACVDTFGCQQNVADGQMLMGMLADCGFTFTEDAKEADLVILNTCAVREHAEQRDSSPPDGCKAPQPPQRRRAPWPGGRWR